MTPILISVAVTPGDDAVSPDSPPGLADDAPPPPDAAGRRAPGPVTVPPAATPEESIAPGVDAASSPLPMSRPPADAVTGVTPAAAPPVPTAVWSATREPQALRSSPSTTRI